MDDDTGWHDVLVHGWGPHVRDAVVARVERASVGRRGTVVRALSDPDHARYAWTEQLHQLVLGAIHAETGVDLDALGSQSAWACYEDAWAALTARWASGGSLIGLPREVEPEALSLLRSLPPAAAEHAGADIGCEPYEPLRVGGRVRIDVEGLFAYLATDAGEVTAPVHEAVHRLIDLART